MAKPKGWKKNNKCFLQSPTNPCLAVVGWEVSVEYIAYDRKEDGKPTAYVSCEISISDEGKHQYVSRKADLRPLRVMRRELDAFEEACLKAITEVEQYNCGK